MSSSFGQKYGNSQFNHGIKKKRERLHPRIHCRSFLSAHYLLRTISSTNLSLTTSNQKQSQGNRFDLKKQAKMSMILKKILTKRSETSVNSYSTNLRPYNNRSKNRKIERKNQSYTEHIKSNDTEKQNTHLLLQNSRDRSLQKKGIIHSGLPQSEALKKKCILIKRSLLKPKNKLQISTTNIELSQNVNKKLRPKLIRKYQEYKVQEAGSLYINKLSKENHEQISPWRAKNTVQEDL